MIKYFLKLCIVYIVINIAYSSYINWTTYKNFSKNSCWIERDYNSFVGMKTTNTPFYRARILGDFFARYLGVRLKDPMVMSPHFGIIVFADDVSLETWDISNENQSPFFIYGWSYLNFEFWEYYPRDHGGGVINASELATHCQSYLLEHL